MTIISNHNLDSAMVLLWMLLTVATTVTMASDVCEEKFNPTDPDQKMWACRISGPADLQTQGLPDQAALKLSFTADHTLDFTAVRYM